MKTCVIFGNCQHSLLEKYLEMTNFKNYYTILRTYDCYCKNIYNLDNDTLRHVDLFIYQHVSKEFDPYFSSDNILSMLPDSCNKICIPNFYFSGYFPQISNPNFERRNVLYSISKIGLMVYGDRNIETMLCDSIDCDTIYNKISNKNFYNKKEIFENFSLSLSNLKKRELEFNVLFSSASWIENNYKQFKICSSVNHPTNQYFIWLTKSILEYLSISDDNVDTIDLNPHSNFLEQPIYPSVFHSLGLLWENSPTKFYDQHITFKQYVKYYFDYCTGFPVLNKCSDVISSNEIKSCKLLPCPKSVNNINQLGVKFKLLKQIPVTNNNYIIINKKIEIFKNIAVTSFVSGLKITFLGFNNYISIGENCVFHNSEIIVNNNTTICIENDCVFSTLKISNRAHNYGEVYISSNVIADTLTIDLLGNNTVTIGSNCLLEKGVRIMPSDGHSVLSNNILINGNKDIYISDHCWIGTECLLLKGSYLNSDTIVSPRSLISKEFKDSNIQISGNPASIVNVNVNWDVRNPQYIPK